MSFTKRVIDVAKANLNALLDKAGAPPDLENLSDAELEAELARRKQRRLRESDEARARESAERAARQRAAQRAAEKMSAAQRANSEAAKDRMSSVDAQFERLKQRAAAGEKVPPPASKQSKQQQQQRRPPPPRTGPGMSEKRLRDLYAQLETPYGAAFDEVKKNFRRLMRKYHPDLHVGDPVKHKTATQLSMSLTTAYNELEVHLAAKK